MEVSGSIKVLGDTQEFGSNGFRKRECVITTNEQYPQTILVEFTQNNTTSLDSYKVGDNVTIQINIRGREWTNPQGEVKYFVSLNGWRIEKVGAAPTAGAPMQDIPAPAAADAPASGSSDEEDDLPF
ncbi:MAG: hypothetical protein CL840_10975 [Crocinitomicaceae bacterium]|nr:hypothetical protein [Crocinitomicaceae bacterium]|tara:strand:- start:11944 stop:12324 length:381 start_codon:yes stop_codon:yes gene_type:complete